MADSAVRDSAEAQQPREAADISTVSILGTDSIRLGFHLADYIASTVVHGLPSSTYVLITDTNLTKLHHARALSDAFRAVLRSDSRFLTHVIAPGEASKSREGKADIEDWLLENHCVRDTVILALGGGVIGDLAGFVASTFMRGVKFCQIPTTLLAMVDSAVGGKTAIDTPLGKNLIGAFWQPEYIFIDAAYLETLPEREFVNGMAEVIKTAAIWSEAEFVKLENGVDSIRSAVLQPPPRSPGHPFPGRFLADRSPAQSLLLDVIGGSIGVKSHIVTVDERETGLRNLVNFGHSVGHAIEALVTPDVLHGEAVAVGMILEAEIARSLGVLGNAAVGRLGRCLKAHGLPTSLGDPIIRRAPNAKSLVVDNLLAKMRVDKKNSGPQKKVVLLSRIGGTYEDKASNVPDDVIARTLAPAVRVFPGPPSSAEVKLATPGSKSISNRALVLAALGEGKCRLKNLLHSDDTQVMMAALEAMNGARFSWEDNGDTLVVEGGGGKLSSPKNEKQVYLGNAGTAARFLTTVCTLVRPESAESRTVITGNARMKQRPIGPLVDALRGAGADIAYTEGQGSLPLSISATPEGFRGGRIQLAASISSQYVSSILLSAPYAAEPVTLELVGGAVISQPYIDMTISMMKTFGVCVERTADASGKPTDVYQIPKGVYRPPAVYRIESDASSSTYPLAVAAITGTTCTILNIGSRSLQGDARFAKDVLEPMGCTVVQSADETTVTGPPPGQLRALGEVDMELMTDAFLTASVLAAVATQPRDPARGTRDQPDNSTRIVGIANQRVKECNRIKAIMDELAKLGVRTGELDDGIEVFGTSAGGLQSDVTVHCYDDHRVAMAFSVLGAAVGGPGLVVEEKRCVEKTWPSWWDDLSAKIGIKVVGMQLKDEESASKLPTPTFDQGASILICGMRGAGKSFSGRVAAAALGWPLIDTDVYFMQKHQTHVRTFVKERGWQAFRAAETEILKELLETCAQGHVISLGGGVVESPENRRLIKAFAAERGPVVEIVRDIDEIVAYLDAEGTRPSLGEPVEALWARRAPWFRECANCEFYNYVPRPVSAGAAGASVSDEAERARAEIGRFFRFFCGVDNNAVDFGNRKTYFLSLTFPSIADPRPCDVPALSRFEELTTGCDAIEFRADLLSPDRTPPAQPAVPPMEFVAKQLSALRRLTSLPVVFTVRTFAQGGMFPDDREDEMFELLRLGLRAGCEYVDVELGNDPEKTAAFCSKKGHSQIIASWHHWSGAVKWDSADVRERYTGLAQYGDIVKLCIAATSLQDNIKMMGFREKAPKQPPLMTISMGREGQLSRILTPIFSPVTHPLMPTRAAPGQLSFGEIQTALGLLGQLPPLEFCLFGHAIGLSKSPLLHNTGFRLLHLPHAYSLRETASMDGVVETFIRSPSFGGASVTIPHKIAIIPLLDDLTPHARAIGAVNTIVPVAAASQPAVRLLGENTDWLAIRDLVARHLPPQSEEGPELVRATALVIGAGGTCRAAIYALHQLGFATVYLFNRTPANAAAVAEAFPRSFNIVPLAALDALPGPAPSAVVSTVPASGTWTSASGSAAGAGVHIPSSVLSRRGGGVVLDMAYAPRQTPLIRLAEATPGWAAVPGIVALLEQGAHQFRLWTGRHLPKSAVSKAVLDAYDQEQNLLQ